MEDQGARPATMAALCWHGRADVRLERVPLPVPAADQALVRVLWTGLCGSDLEEYLHGPVVARPPVVLGHEIVGAVAAPAADGSGPAVGTVVVVDVVTGCGRCWWCQRHEEGRCPDLVVTGLDVDGGLAEHVVARASRLVPVPPGLDPRDAALAEPLAVAVRAARRAGPLLGRGALVVGAGTVGLLLAQVLAHVGAAPVLALEPDPGRRALAGRLGVDARWEREEDRRAALVAAAFPARGPDVVAECSGADGAPREAVRLVRRGGTALLLGVSAHDQPVDVTDAVLGEKTVVGSAAHMVDDDVAPAVALLASGAVQVAPLVTHTVPLARAERAFELLADPGSGAVKVLVGVAGHEERHDG